MALLKSKAKSVSINPHVLFMAKRGPKIIPFKELQVEPLTIESLRCYAGCEHYTDEQASSIIDTLRHYANISLKAVLKKEALPVAETITDNPLPTTTTHPANHRTICLSPQKKAA